MFGVKAGIASSQRLLAAPITTTPNITNYGVRLYKDPFTNETYNQFYWKVQNLDASTATIYTSANDSTPGDNAGSIAPNDYTGERTYTTALSTNTITVYAKAQASGKELSAYDSQVIEAI